MEYLDFCIGDSKEDFSPVSVDAIYYVFADKTYHVKHLCIPNSYVLVATLSGSGTMKIGNQIYTLHAGEVFLFDASKENFSYSCDDVSWNFWWFEFKILKKQFMELPLFEVFLHPLNEKEIYLCEESLCALKLQNAKTTSSLFSALLCLLQTKSIDTQNEYKGVEIFKKADAYIRKNLGTATVKSTADALAISERTLLSVFRKQLNISTIQYINNLKLDMARHLLLTSEMPIHDIADTLGYPDQFVFSKSFKKRFGASPRKYKGQKFL